MPIKDRSGKIIGLVGASIDITDRRKAEAAKVWQSEDENHRHLNQKE